MRWPKGTRGEAFKEMILREFGVRCVREESVLEAAGAVIPGVVALGCGSHPGVGGNAAGPPISYPLGQGGVMQGSAHSTVDQDFQQQWEGHSVLSSDAASHTWP